MRVWSVVAEMIGSHGRCALVNAEATRGSVPPESGARMVVVPGGDFRGTISGGELEWRVFRAARGALSRNVLASMFSRPTLGPDLGQCRDRSVRLLTEVFDRDRDGGRGAASGAGRSPRHFGGTGARRRGRSGTVSGASR